MNLFIKVINKIESNPNITCNPEIKAFISQIKPQKSSVGGLFFKKKIIFAKMKMMKKKQWL